MITKEMVLTVLYVLLAISFVMIWLVFHQKTILLNEKRNVQKAREFIFNRYFDEKDCKNPVKRHTLFREFINVSEQIILSPIVKERYISDLIAFGYLKKYLKELNSYSKYKRKRAAFYLGYLSLEDAENAIIKRLQLEKEHTVKLYLTNAIKKSKRKEAFLAILESMVNSPQSYVERVTTILCNHYSNVKPWIKDILLENRFEIVYFLAHCASIEPNPLLKTFVLEYLEICDNRLELETFDDKIKDYSIQQATDIRYICAKALSKHYPNELQGSYYTSHPDNRIQTLSIEGLGHTPTFDTMRKLFFTLDESNLDNIRIEMISKIVHDNKELFLELVKWFSKMDKMLMKKAAARILATRMDDIILRLKSDRSSGSQAMIQEIASFGHTAEIIDFINANKDRELSKALENIVLSICNKIPTFEEECRIYLNKSFLNAIGMTPLELVLKPKEKAKPEKRKIRWMIRILIFSVLFFPVLFLLVRFREFRDTEFLRILQRFVIDFNLYIVGYYVIVNMLYMFLIVLSFIGAKKQINLWNLKKASLIYERALLPTISIIAPAYNEELSIIESITSLLNLKYPKYEVVVVNDGSKDNTLKKLIEHFQLERKNPLYEERIPTKRIRGVYRTQRIPNLLVIDKENGGKADALNVGINFAKYVYVCGIDADSLLDGESLQKLMTVTLDYEEPLIALGGNIYPSNGCIIDRGKVEKKGLGRNGLVRFQSIEYVRAFTTGRIGWARLKSLLIISGAFGLFDKRMLIQAGGYLTSSSVLQKDTVGEDMELVVRMTTKALEAKKPYRVDYIYNANCYTELPGDMNTLLKQRNRWHRGLIDILSYHRKVMFHPRYKQLGFIAYPYFFIFEVVGPLFEAQGYAMLFIALVFGLLNPPVIAAIFLATIGLGIVVSLASLLLAEREEVYLGKKDTITLVIYAILENFGYRQLMSLYRARGFFSALRETNQWGTQKRQGFQTVKK